MLYDVCHISISVSCYDQVGCGAIGCEMMKLYALLGIGTDGKVNYPQLLHCYASWVTLYFIITGYMYLAKKILII